MNQAIVPAPLAATPLAAASMAAERHNALLQDGAVRTLVRYAARHEARFRSDTFLQKLSALPRFPALSVGELLASARAAGLALTGGHATLEEATTLPTPFLAYLKRGEDAGAGLDLVHVQELRRRTVVVASDAFGTQTMPRAAFDLRWSGIVLRIDQPQSINDAPPSEIDAYRTGVRVIPDMLTGGECAELIAYCEDACFRRSRVVQRRRNGTSDVVEARVRSSSSVVLPDRRHPLLAQLYDRVAALERAAPHDIEHIQCVRYKRGQKFRPHFDGGVDLPRLATYLLYLNDDFTGGETYFPMLDLSVAPRAGSCLRFASCSPDGRMLWPSEHGGLPVRNGVKYALNIWVRCPSVVSPAA